MKRLTLVAILVFSCNFQNSMPMSVRMIDKAPEVKMIDEWEVMYKAICEVESENGKNVYNKYSNAVGVIQIRPIYVKDVNRIEGCKKFKLKDRLDPKKSREMFDILQSYYNPDRDIETGILIHIKGHSGHKRNRKGCRWYLDRVENKIDSIKQNLKDMKYVVFKRGDMEIPVAFPDQIAHSMVSIGTDWEAVSAGFFKVSGIGFPIIDECGSDSLKLKPRMEKDWDLLTAMLKGFGTNSFINYDNI